MPPATGRVPEIISGNTYVSYNQDLLTRYVKVSQEMPTTVPEPNDGDQEVPTS